MGYKGRYDFCGWATKNNLRCADGRVIRKNAFKINDGEKVPLVWNHNHDNPSRILGHAVLENRDEGVYAYASFNNTQAGQDAKETVIHGDIVGMSIWANNLEQENNDVIHGVIREVSLVLARANPGAFVESVLAHGESMGEDEDEGIFYTGEGIYLAHSGESSASDDDDDDEGINIKKVFDSMTEEQQNVVAYLVGSVLEDKKKDQVASGMDEDLEDEEEEDDEIMKHNMFDRDQTNNVNVISHSDMAGIFAAAKKCGSLKEAVEESLESGVLSHAIETTGMDTSTAEQAYFVDQPSFLFPEYKSLNNPPEFIKRDMGWVSVVMNGVHHTPYTRIKSQFANITEDEARAKGYIKGRQKKEEVFSLLKRTTDPQTIYKLQKMDRDDVLDITDFDVVAWIKAEMRMMLDEEIARAILIGDGRPADNEFKIKEDHIRPIISDVSLFNTKYKIGVPANASGSEVATAIIEGCIRSRKNYKGSGNPILFTTEDFLTEMLLLKDGLGHPLYKTETELATTLRVSRIVTVEPMEGYKIVAGANTYDLIGTIINLNDYNVGADKGGQVSMFEDFDIRYNQQDYLIETRISGALIKPYSAITLVLAKDGSTSGIISGVVSSQGPTAVVDTGD